MQLVSFIEKALERATEKGLKKTNLVMSAMIEPAQFFAAMTGRRPFSNILLKKLATIPEMETTYEQLLILKLIDEYGFDTMHAAVREFARIEEQEQKEK